MLRQKTHHGEEAGDKAGARERRTRPSTKNWLSLCIHIRKDKANPVEEQEEEDCGTCRGSCTGRKEEPSCHLPAGLCRPRRLICLTSAMEDGRNCSLPALALFACCKGAPSALHGGYPESILWTGAGPSLGPLSLALPLWLHRGFPRMKNISNSGSGHPEL